MSLKHRIDAKGKKGKEGGEGKLRGTLVASSPFISGRTLDLSLNNCSLFLEIKSALLPNADEDGPPTLSL